MTKSTNIESHIGSKITISEDGSYVFGTQKLEKVEITLAECFACSGCITSAEGVLITQQSQEEFLRVLEENEKAKETGDVENVRLIVFTVSQQPVLSVAKRYGLDFETCAKKLLSYFKNLWADLVISTKIADDFALIEARIEFLDHFNSEAIEGSKNLSMLVSSCLGWVCYAEKTHGHFIFSYISTARPPTDYIGVLVIQFLAQQHGFSANKIYYVTIMPCYDKKLGASREDFFNEALQSRDVDCVITSNEIEQMLEKTGDELTNMTETTFDWPWSRKYPDKQIHAHEFSGSGGNSDHIFKYAAKSLFDEEIHTLDYKPLRNLDYKEVILERDGKFLRFTIANGFRNIQNLVQKLKRGKSAHHYVKVMACASTGKDCQSPRRIMKKRNTFGGVKNDKAKALLRTSYHAVEKMNTVLRIKW